MHNILRLEWEFVVWFSAMFVNVNAKYFTHLLGHLNSLHPDALKPVTLNACHILYFNIVY
jgi:hypothetical protein